MADRPTGTVTFLLTDIEGSTALWERQPEAMARALARHDHLVTTAVHDRGGVVVKSRGEGDSIFAVFGRASDGVAAAGTLQRALMAERWPTDVPLRVRMGLHTGEAELREGDYYGAAVNRCARLRAAGHGGQILLSEATAALVRGTMAGGAGLRDLGPHRLKDLREPERIYQLVLPTLTGESPALRTLEGRPNNLPVQPTPLLGREHEVEAARGLLVRDDVRLLTLTGPGGTGKTRLGLQVAADLLDRVEDGVFFVPLAPISDPELVVTTIAQALGVRQTGGRRLVDTLKDYLRDKHLLLLLDNFEQVLPAASLVADLLGACPNLKALVTSRATLHLRAEKEFPVPTLALPDPTHLPLREALSQYAAVALFVQRALDVKPDFAVTDENAPAVAEICTRLDGLPLAIELAAARVKLLPPQALLVRLGSRLTLLTGGARDLPARQQTLRDAITWSYDLLDETEQALFRRLGAFVGGCTLEAAEAVCDADGEPGADAFDGIASLVDKSLLRRHDGPDGQPRFTMLETIREYALELLVASGEAEALRRRYAEYYLALAERAEPELRGAEQLPWLERLEADHANLRAALDWSATTGAVERGLRLVGALWWFWRLHSYPAEGRTWLERILERADAPDAGRAKALVCAGHLAYLQGAWDEARPLLEEGLAIGRRLGDGPTVARALIWAGFIALYRGEHAVAQSHAEGGRTVARDAGDLWMTAWALLLLGRVAQGRGEYAAARPLLEESLAIRRGMGDWYGVGHALVFLGIVAIQLGDYDGARSRFRDSLARVQRVGDRGLINSILAGLALVRAAQGQPEQALRLAGAAAALSESAGVTIRPDLQALLDRGLESARRAMADATWARIWAEGRSMTPEQAIAYALEEPTPS